MSTKSRNRASIFHTLIGISVFFASATSCASANAQCVEDIQVVSAYGFSGGRVKDLAVLDVGQGPELFALANQLYRSSDGENWMVVDTPEQGMLTLGTYAGELLVGSGVQGVWAWNGSTWRTLDSLTGGVVKEFVNAHGRVYARGTFTTGSNGVFSPGLAYWDGTSWNGTIPGGSLGSVSGMCEHLGNLIAVSGQGNVAGTGQQVAVYNGSSWSAFPVAIPFYANKFVRKVGSDGTQLYLFFFPDEAFGDGVAVYYFDGEQWRYSNSLHWDTIINDTAAVNGVLYVAGNGYEPYDAGFVAQYGQLGAHAQVDARFAAQSSFDSVVSSVVAFNGTVVVGGSFDTLAGTVRAADGIGRFNGLTPIPTGAVNPGRINALASFGGELVLAGTIQSLADANHDVYVVNNLVRYDGTEFSSYPNTTFSGSEIRTLESSGSSLYVGGQFNLTTPSSSFSKLAKWNGTAWSNVGSPTDFGISGNSASVEAIEVVGSNVFVGGRFTTAGLQSGVGNIAYWNGSAWTRMGSGTNGTVYSIKAFGSDIIAVGTFTLAGSASVTGAARWNGTAWSAFGNVSGLTTLETHNGALFGAGASTTNILRWNGSSWVADSPDGGPGNVRQLFSDGNRLFAVTATGQSWVRIDANKWNQLSSSAVASGSNGGLRAVATWNGEPYIGGGNASLYYPGERLVFDRIAVTNMPPEFTQQPQGAELDDGDDYLLEVAIDAAWEPVTYQWYVDNTLIPGATGSSLLLSDATPADSGDYHVVVDSFCGSAMSDVATIVVHPACYPDIDGDRSVGLSDLAYLLRSFGLCFGSPGFDPTADINRTNCVDLMDLAQLLAVFGSECP